MLIKKPSLIKSFKRRFYLLAVFFAFNSMIYGLVWWGTGKTPFLNKLTKAYHLDNKIHFPPDYRDKMLDVEASVGLYSSVDMIRLFGTEEGSPKTTIISLEIRTGWVLPPLVEVQLIRTTQ